LIRTPRTQSNADPLSTDFFDDRIHDLYRKSCSLLDTPAPSILPGIAQLLQKLIDEISVCTMYFDAIEACCDGVPGGGNIGVDICLYL
jgi:hypothetical protein